MTAAFDAASSHSRRSLAAGPGRLAGEAVGPADGARYTPRMDSGTAARQAIRDVVAGMTLQERIALAYALGDEDVRLFMAVSQLEREEAVAMLRRARHHGRQHSVAGALDGVA